MIKNIEAHGNIVRFVDEDRSGFTSNVVLNDIDVNEIVETLYYAKNRLTSEPLRRAMSWVKTMDVAEVKQLMGELARILNS